MCSSMQFEHKNGVIMTCSITEQNKATLTRRTLKRRLYACNALWKFLTGAIFKNKFLTIENGPK